MFKIPAQIAVVLLFAAAAAFGQQQVNLAATPAGVTTPDGNERFPLLHPNLKADDLLPGMTVFLDPKGSIVLGVDDTLPTVGQEGTFLRCLDDGVVEASIRDERLMLYGSQSVRDSVSAGEL